MVNEVRIRPATRDDLPGLVASSSGLFAEDAGTRDPTVDQTWPAREAEGSFAAQLDDPDALILVAAADGVVGHLTGRVAEPSAIRPIRVATLRSLYVRPAYRSSGVGAELVDRFLAWASERGAERAAVSAFASNDGAIRFYERHGFTPYTIVLEQSL